MDKNKSIIGSKIKGKQTLTLRSPEMLAPANIPVAAGKKTENTEKNDSPLNWGRKLATNTSAEN